MELVKSFIKENRLKNKQEYKVFMYNAKIKAFEIILNPPKRKDCRAFIELADGRKCGINTQGDPSTGVGWWLETFKNEGCDFYHCYANANQCNL